MNTYLQLFILVRDAVRVQGLCEDGASEVTIAFGVGKPSLLVGLACPSRM